MTMVLHNFDLDDDCYRVRLTAAIAGVALTLRNVDVVPGKEHLSPGYLALNPLGRLPILQDGDVCLTQTSAIMRRIASAGTTRLVPQDADSAARMDNWLSFAERELSIASQARAMSIFGLPGDLDAVRARAVGLIRVMDDHMTRQRIRGEGYFAGPDVSLADLALFPAFALSRDFNLDHDAFPALRIWGRLVEGLPGFIVMPGIPAYH